MSEPRADRPAMPGYGIDTDTAGLLPWSWAEQRLVATRNYWLATTFPDGRPHVMPVWAVWADGLLWFSSAAGSRKARNLRRDPRCVITTENGSQPVVVEGPATFVTDPALLARYVELTNAKYDAGLDLDFVAPARSAVVRVAPVRVIALDDDAFTATPTRWTF
jgi:PPOX class probable F420-dependent enzyme